METKNIIISVVVGLLVLGVGFFGGVMYNNLMTPNPVVSPQTVQGNSQMVKDLSSKVIPSIAAYGQIAKIDGRNVTVSYQGDTVVIPIRADAKIYSFVDTATAPSNGTKPKTTAPTSKQITFEDLKVSNNVSVNIRVLATGALEGFSVVVLPAPTVPAAN